MLTETLNPMNFMNGIQLNLHTFQNPELKEVRKSKCSHSLRSCNRISNEYNFIISLKRSILRFVLCTFQYNQHSEFNVAASLKFMAAIIGVNCEHFIFGGNLTNYYDWNDGVCISRLLTSFYRHCIHNVHDT